MKSNAIYFSDNFFSAGKTSIYDENKGELGTLDLKSAFSSSLSVWDASNNLVVEGRFRFFTRKWFVTNATGHELGTLRQKWSFFTKKYEYETNGRGTYLIISEGFSKEYRVLNQNEQIVAHFEKKSNFFQSDAYKLTNNSDELSNEELVAMVMGITMIIKQNHSAASSPAAT
ncbi:hypothetical protein [Pseudalkalibacillus berkeleyi]|uniref:Uncharacterized protein n=1 Tax=Pseudalkalibacillus berkeleyi TaxID=1069813 RepID=A0ABS9H626_9BACL|nr:hypothetical protein [Pseudalkalibacillus berkeleyi]MCF6139250.1 hypothetical protein [Pseudalkalibacillus berkeleyi]